MRAVAAGGGSRGPRLALMVGFMCFVAYTAVFGMQGSDVTRPPVVPSLTGLPEAEKNDEKEWKESKRTAVDDDGLQTTKAVRSDDGVRTVHGVPFLDPPFGYSKKRNEERWEVIFNSIKSDNRENAFSVVDYGADEGYFSISTAYAFPDAVVMALDMGGHGGSIWKKEYDVLKIQESKIDEYSVGDRVTICQTAVKPEHFFKLAEQRSGHDYQLVLSVLHWFDIADRTEFEKVLTTLFQNAKTTFIELPIAGDFGPRFMRQVGAKKFVKWYDGRSDIHQIITDSLKARGVSGSVSKIGSVHWLPGKKGERGWDRELFRVDMHDAPSPFSCRAHFAVYGCAETTTPASVKYSKCPARP